MRSVAGISGLQAGEDVKEDLRTEFKSEARHASSLRPD